MSVFVFSSVQLHDNIFYASEFIERGFYIDGKLGCASKLTLAAFLGYTVSVLQDQDEDVLSFT